MGKLSPVRVPARRKLQRFCQTGMPLVAFLLCGAMVVYFWRSSNYGAGTVGELLPIRSDLTAQIPGTLISLDPTNSDFVIDEFTEVEEGSLLALLDREPLQRRIDVLQAEAEHLRSSVESERATAEFEDAKLHLETTLNKAQITVAIARDLAGVSVDYMKTRVLYDAASLEYKINEQRYQLQLPYADVMDDGQGKVVPKPQTAESEAPRGRPAVSAPEMAVLIREMRLAKTNMDGYLKALKAIEEQRRKLVTATKAMQPRRDKLTDQERSDLDLIAGDLPPMPTTNVEKLIAPIMKEAAAKDAEVAEIESQMKFLEIRAPFAGTVVAVYARPGQAVQPSTIICTVAAHDFKYVLAYVRQQANLRPEVGMRADVRFRGRSDSVQGTIMKIGAQVEAVSLKQLLDPNTQEWGLPVAIKLNWNDEIKRKIGPRPGEVVFVQIRPNDIDNSAKASSEVVSLKKDGVVVARRSN